MEQRKDTSFLVKIWKDNIDFCNGLQVNIFLKDNFGFAIAL